MGPRLGNDLGVRREAVDPERGKVRRERRPDFRTETGAMESEWARSDIALSLVLHLCSTGTTPVRHYIGTTLVPHRCCAGTALVLLWVLDWYCTGTVRVLHRHCTGTALVLHKSYIGYCTGTTPMLRWQCTGPTRVLSWHCFGTAPLRHSHTGAAVALY